MAAGAGFVWVLIDSDVASLVSPGARPSSALSLLGKPCGEAAVVCSFWRFLEEHDGGAAAAA